MSRIISGLYGGRYLDNPRHAIRPTTGKVKEYIFNVFQRCDGFTVLDMFAGTGALGIEALSRGADSLILVDNNVKSIQLIKKNLSNLGITADSASVVRHNAIRFMETCTMSFDLILADPPYDLHMPFEFFENAVKKLNPSGRFVFEYATRNEFDHGTAQCLRKKTFGDSSIWIFE